MSREYILHPVERSPDLRIDYEAELNPQQYAAVAAGTGPSLVLAGAGAGKTRTLTYRVAWLLEHGVPAERILLLTFTNKSAREMMHRVSDLLAGDLSGLWGGTFHSIGNRILRLHASTLGYKSGFSIADREDSKDLIATCVAESGVDIESTRFPKPDALADLFSQAANMLEPVENLVAKEYDSFLGLTQQILTVARVYAEKKRVSGLMDFDDLLALWLRLLKENREIGEVYQRRFQWVLVDEYQDTNKLQGELLDQLVARHGNLMAVGDDAQSIYSWRGAHFANILDFPKRYSAAKVYRIETNYRSTPQILQVANAAIAPNTRQHPKELVAARKPGVKPALVVCNDNREQANFVCQRVLELRDEGVNLSEMSVLYRSHFHALELQLELTRRNIPFVITSGIRFFEQAHIKDAAAYLKLLTNPRDELAFKRLVKMLPGIGGKGADKLWAAYRDKLESNPPPPALFGGSPDVAPQETESESAQPTTPAVPAAPAESAARALGLMTKQVPKKTAVAWAQFAATMSQIEDPEVRDKPGKVIRLVVEAVFHDYVVETYDNSRNRLDEISQLAGYAEGFDSTTEFLSQLALQSHLEGEENRPKPDDEDRLRLSTVHQAKGLEFKAVFLIMLSDGMFPSIRSLESGDMDILEEERRLFYVAVTRAKDELYLTRPLLRYSQSGGLQMQTQSQFLNAIPSDLLDEWHLTTYGAIPRHDYNPKPRYEEEEESDSGEGGEPF